MGFVGVVGVDLFKQSLYGVVDEENIFIKYAVGMQIRQSHSNMVKFKYFVN